MLFLHTSVFSLGNIIHPSIVELAIFIQGITSEDDDVKLNSQVVKFMPLFRIEAY